MFLIPPKPFKGALSKFGEEIQTQILMIIQTQIYLFVL